jgi:hypothetical protein
MVWSWNLLELVVLQKLAALFLSEAEVNTLMAHSGKAANSTFFSKIRITLQDYCRTSQK